jgi:hypothetical protein
MSDFFKKIRSGAFNFAKKVRHGFNTGSKKVRSFAQEVGKLVKEVNDISPLISTIVDDITDIIPGAAPLKKVGKYALGAFNTIGSIANRVDRGTAIAQDKVRQADTSFDKVSKSNAGARIKRYFNT